MISRTLTHARNLLLAALLCACGGGGGASTSPATTAPPAPADPATLAILMFGNSHTAFNDLPGMLRAMLLAGRPGRSVAITVAPTFLTLEERFNDPASRTLFARQTWSAVILQAQQYSQSGNYQYSTAEAIAWVRMARQAGSLPVMFPEWPRLGINETQRIFDLHVSIAQQAAACVPPIPQAFDRAAQQFPSLVLHNPDGNHSSPAGAFLAALMLYATLTGNAPLDLPLLPAFPVDAASQASLRAVADQQVRAISPRMWCPADSSL